MSNVRTAETPMKVLAAYSLCITSFAALGGLAAWWKSPAPSNQYITDLGHVSIIDGAKMGLGIGVTAATVAHVTLCAGMYLF
jgi:hypothetical protein